MGAELTRREFARELDRFIADFRAKALEYFSTGVEGPRAIRLAIQWSAMMALDRAKRMRDRALEARSAKRGD